MCTPLHRHHLIQSGILILIFSSAALAVSGHAVFLKSTAETMLSLLQVSNPRSSPWIIRSSANANPQIPSLNPSTDPLRHPPTNPIHQPHLTV
jgi:hypothetical protein